MLKIKQTIFADFLKKISIPGDTPLDEFILEATPNGLKMASFSVGHLIFVKSLLKKEAFETFDEKIRIPVNLSSRLLSYVNRFSGVITLEVKENRLIIKSNRNSAEMLLPTEDFITKIADPKMEFDAGFNIKASLLTEVAKDKELLEAGEIKLQVIDKQFVITIGDDKSDRFSRSVEADYKNVVSIYGAGIKSVFKTIDGEVNLSFKDNFPLRIKKITKEYIVEYIMAPVMTQSQSEG